MSFATSNSRAESGCHGSSWPSRARAGLARPFKDGRAAESGCDLADALEHDQRFGVAVAPDQARREVEPAPGRLPDPAAGVPPGHGGLERRPGRDRRPGREPDEAIGMIQSSGKTISNMMSVILAKMGVHDRVEAAALARGLPGVQGRDTGRDG
jgi:hypothetical protein